MYFIYLNLNGDFEDPDQTPRSAVSGLCLQIIHEDETITLPHVNRYRGPKLYIGSKEMLAPLSIGRVHFHF